MARAPAPPRQPDTDERLRRLARAYADGAYTDEEYAARRAGIQAAGAAPSPQPAPDLDRAAALDRALDLVGSIPQLWAANATPRRRALLGQLLSHVYARQHRIYAIRPTRAAEPLFRAIWAETGRDTPSCSPPCASRPILLAAA